MTKTYYELFTWLKASDLHTMEMFKSEIETKFQLKGVLCITNYPTSPYHCILLVYGQTSTNLITQQITLIKCLNDLLKVDVKIFKPNQIKIKTRRVRTLRGAVTKILPYLTDESIYRSFLGSCELEIQNAIRLAKYNVSRSVFNKEYSVDTEFVFANSGKNK